MRRGWFALGFLFGAFLVGPLVGCGGNPPPPAPGPTPWTPTPPPPSPPPPPPPDNPPQPSAGSITEAQYDAVAEGIAEADLVAALGVPFQKRPVAGMTKYLYLLADPHIAWFFVVDGKVVRKSRL